MKCAVCKQDFKDGEIKVKTIIDGVEQIVHMGSCQDYLQEQSSQQLVENTELLLD